MSLPSSSSSKQAGADVITCKAAVAWAAGEALVIEEVQVSPPQPMEIRIKVVCTSLCRSDITAWLSQVTLIFVFLHIVSSTSLVIISSFLVLLIGLTSLSLLPSSSSVLLLMLEILLLI